MIVEMRTYTLALGATGRYFKLYGEKGLAVQKRIRVHALTMARRRSKPSSLSSHWFGSSP